MSIFSILNHPCSLWFILISLVFSYLSKVLFSGFIQFKGNFVDGQNNSKYRNIAPLRNKGISKPTALQIAQFTQACAFQLIFYGNIQPYKHSLPIFIFTLHVYQQR